MTKPIVTGCSAYPTITPGESGETVTIWGDYLLVEDSKGRLQIPEVTCEPGDGVTFAVTPETLQESRDVSLKAIIDLDEATDGWRSLKVKTGCGEESDPKEKAFRVVDAAIAAEDPDKPYEQS